jgi:hypothetical protein
MLLKRNVLLFFNPVHFVQRLRFVYRNGTLSSAEEHKKNQIRKMNEQSFMNAMNSIRREKRYSEHKLNMLEEELRQYFQRRAERMMEREGLL